VPNKDTSGIPGTLSTANPGMPLKPPSRASPMAYWSPAVAFMNLNRISVTTSVITPMYTSLMRP
jgi:hypothetical protein